MARQSKSKKKSVSLVLASGGARGLAHIGVIEELERFGFEIRSIAGASIGALVGGLYASGHLDDFKRWIVDLDQLDIFRLVDFSLGSHGFIKGDRVFQAMQSFFPDCDIRSLPIPFAAVAVDIHAEREVVFRQGSLHEAIRASIAIPGVMQSRQYQGRVLVDGGVLNPIPIDAVLRQPADYLCVVNLNARGQYQAPSVKSAQQAHNDSIYEKGIARFRSRWAKYLPQASTMLAAPVAGKPERLGHFDVMMRSFDLVQDRLCQQIIDHARPDLIVEVPRTACGVFDFHKADEMIEAGRRAFHQALGWKLVRDADFKL